MHNKKIYRYMNILSVILCFVSILLPIIFWNKIPDEIPRHYNEFGQPDAYGSKSTLILVFFGELMTLGAMLFGHVLVKMMGSSQNSSESEKTAVNIICPMLAVLNLGIVLIFSYMIFCSATCRPLGSAFLIVALLVTFVPIVLFLGKYMKAQSQANKKDSALWKEKETTSQPVIYRSKVDIWLGALLGISILLPIWLMIHEFIQDGDLSITLVVTNILLLVLVLPLFFIKYALYEEHLTVSCGLYGTFRIPYHSITGMKKTLNPLSSAALSMKRIQIDYNKNGTTGMILISPKDRDAFIAEIEKHR